MEECPKRTETYKRKEPPGILFFWGSFCLLDVLLPIQYRNIWTALGGSLVILITLFVVIYRIKGWYYTKWIVFILIFILGEGLYFFNDINGN
ncbi:UNVERIFIED_ORG: signal transduction histidine kinase [Peribacillus simplex]